MAIKLATSLIRIVADLVLPPRCPGCGIPVAEDHRFCATCWANLRFIAPPWCAGCNLPFGFELGAGALCGSCLEKPPRHAGVRAAVGYGPVARRVALRLKYGGKTGLAVTAARLMTRLVPDDAQLLVPVPLHRWRLWSRGYNQAGLIASALEELSGAALDRDALVRHRATNVLRGLGGGGRRKAVSGAFAVAEPARVKGKRVVLVDDVYTSGATAEACTRVLLGAGAASVTVLCWARVLPDEA